MARCNLIIFDMLGQICTVKCRQWAGCSQQSAFPWCLTETSGFHSPAGGGYSALLGGN